MITSTDIAALYNNAKKEQQSDINLLNFQIDKLSLTTAFREMLNSVFNELDKNVTFDVLMGGSAPWQYINALIHGTSLIESESTSIYRPSAPPECLNKSPAEIKMNNRQNI